MASDLSTVAKAINYPARVPEIAQHFTPSDYPAAARLDEIDVVALTAKPRPVKGKDGKVRRQQDNEAIVHALNVIDQSRPERLDPTELMSLPQRNVTFGYSFAAFELASTLIGCQRRPFSFSDLAIVAQSGLDLSMERIKQYSEPESMRWMYNQAFHQHHNHVPIARSSRDDPWYEQYEPSLEITVFSRQLDEIYRDLFIWMEIRDSIHRLEKLGMAETGMAARRHATESGPIRAEFWFLRAMVSHMGNVTSRQVKEAYAVGSQMVERHQQWADGDSPYREYARFECTLSLKELRSRDYMKYCLARFCLAPDLPQMPGITKRLNTLYHQLCYEHSVKTNPQGAIPINQRLGAAISNWSLAIDSEQSINLAFPEGYVFPEHLDDSASFLKKSPTHASRSDKLDDVMRFISDFFADIEVAAEIGKVDQDVLVTLKRAKDPVVKIDLKTARVECKG